jgi:serine/threonine protein kinase
MTEQVRRHGPWQVLDRLGKGGNGVVWRAVHDDGRQAAIKVLSRSGADRRARFLDEIRFLLDGPQRPGVMPLLDADLDAKPPYYVMPVATSLRTHLGPDPSVDDVLKALLTVAETLADLSAEGIGHRDIKPDNLFAIDGEVVVGDFGLVSYPDKRSITRAGRRVGPVDYMAPEMRANADTAIAEPADVYALAKTAWVLLTQRELPLPGPHRVDDEATSLRLYIEHPRLGELDSLLAAATRHDPTARPALAEVSAELRLILLPPPEAAEAPDVASLVLRVGKLATSAQEADRVRQIPARAAEQVLGELNRYLLPIHLDVLSKLPGLSASHRPGYGFHTLLRPHTPPPGTVHSMGLNSVVVQPTRPPPGEVLIASIGMELTEPEIVHLTAGYGIITEGGCEVVWVAQRSARLCSAALAAAVDELGIGLREHLAEALAGLARRLSA